MNPAHQTPGLVKRQKLILGRMGVVTPPPDPPVAEEPAKTEPPVTPDQPVKTEPPPEKIIK
jgi:hypothetical protein